MTVCEVCGVECEFTVISLKDGVQTIRTLCYEHCLPHVQHVRDILDSIPVSADENPQQLSA